MSRKTVAFRRKIRQANRKNTSLDCLVPTRVVRGSGRKTIFGQADIIGEDGKAQRDGKRYPGRDTGLICTQPMSEPKASRLCSLK